MSSGKQTFLYHFQTGLLYSLFQFPVQLGRTSRLHPMTEFQILTSAKVIFCPAEQEYLLSGGAKSHLAVAGDISQNPHHADDRCGIDGAVGPFIIK